jgi:hypothetical protein
MKMKGKSQLGSFRWTRSDVTMSVLNEMSVALGFNPNDIDGLIHAPLPDPDALSPEQFRTAYWRAEVWSKYPFNTGIDREKVALSAFFEYEQRCAESNRRLCDAWSRPIPERYRSWLRCAASLMERLFEGFNLDEIVQHCYWGPGASTSMRRLNATPQNKWVQAAHMSEPVLPYKHAFEQWSGRKFADPVIVRGNKVVTVPKNAKTDRTIAIEPDWNMFFQLGFGGAIRRRLQRCFGLLRGNAQEVNQALARAGSLDGFLATVDLKGASDTVSLALVELLVPQCVLKHLLALRSPCGVLPDGSMVTYEKISSMGNGYTFELETAIFYCLVRACSGYARAYGDDIVCPSSCVTQVIDFLDFCGFAVNEKKTHYSGPFRESCGGHFHSGVNVTPPYVRKPLVGPARLSFCNRVSELSDNGYWRDSLLKSTWDVCAQGIPGFLRGPKGVDGVLHVSFSQARPKFSKKLQTFTGTRLLESRRSVESSQIGGLLQSLWQHGSEVTWRQTGFEKKSNDPVLSYRTWWQGWSDVSPWCVAE